MSGRSHLLYFGSSPVALVLGLLLASWQLPSCTVMDVAGRGIGFYLALMAMPTALLLYRRRDSLVRASILAAVTIAVTSLVGYNLFVNMGGAVDRGRQKMAMAQMREIAKSIDRDGQSPFVRAVRTSPDRLPELHDAAGAVLDPWGNPYALRLSAEEYTLVSYGACGHPDVSARTEYASGPTGDFHADIVLENGEFVRWPHGRQN